MGLFKDNGKRKWKRQKYVGVMYGYYRVPIAVIFGLDPRVPSPKAEGLGVQGFKGLGA